MDLAARLDAAAKRRANLVAAKERIQGKYEAAQKNLAAVETEIRERKIEPGQLAETRQALEDRHQRLIEEIERDVAAGEEALAPFLKES